MNYEIEIIGGLEFINPENDNIDVEITLEDGRVYSASFFTLKNIQEIMNKYKSTGECINGLYFMASDMIIIEEISEDKLRNTISDIIMSENISAYFSLLRKNP